MKKSALNTVAAGLVSELFQKRIIDDNAESIAEISERTGLSRWSANRFVTEMMNSGKIEKVWKHGSIRPIPAYCIKKK